VRIDGKDSTIEDGGEADTPTKKTKKKKKKKKKKGGGEPPDTPAKKCYSDVTATTPVTLGTAGDKVRSTLISIARGVNTCAAQFDAANSAAVTALGRLVGMLEQGEAVQAAGVPTTPLPGEPVGNAPADAPARQTAGATSALSGWGPLSQFAGAPALRISPRPPPLCFRFNSSILIFASVACLHTPLAAFR
jgi:hypothetical protein